MKKRDGLPTIYDIAKHAAVSPKTVSRVINGNTRVAAELRERVERSVAELGFTPRHAARALGGPRGFAIALLTAPEVAGPIDDDDWYRGPYFGEIEAGALRAAQHAGYRFVIEGVDLDSTDLDAELRRLDRMPVDGVLLSPPGSDCLPLLDALERRGTPYVRISPGIDLDRGASVAIDDHAGAACATEHLLALGHRRIAMIAGPESHLAAGLRVGGFREAMGGHGATSIPGIIHGDFMPATGYHAAQRLLALPDRPTAIVAANDAMAAGAMRAAFDMGIRIPEQLSVTGFDDVDIALYTWPPLTTIRQPLRAMTRAAVDYLVATLGGDEAASRHTRLAFRLVERQSTSSPD